MTRGWLRVAASIAVLCVLGDIGGAVLHAQSRRAQTQLTTGIECFRRGDYQLADDFFQQALVGQDDLSPAEKQELQNRIQQNNIALKGQRDGTDQVRRAEEAVKAGRTQDAMNLLKEVSSNSFLTPADRQKADQLAQAIRPRTSGPTSQPVASSTTTTPLLRARAKLEQARKLLARNDYANAEQLVNEADALGAVFTPGEDTPKKVREDIAKTRANDKHYAATKPTTPTTPTTLPATLPTTPEPKDAKGLLAAGRAAYEKGDYDKAEHYAHEAEKSDSWMSMHLFGDSPAKLLKDVQVAKAKLPAKPTTPPTGVAAAGQPKPNTPAANATPGTTPTRPTQNAAAPAVAATTPRDVKPTTPKENTPSTSGANVAQGPTVITGPGQIHAETKDYKILLVEGRAALDKGDLDKAEKLGREAQKADTSWTPHMFGDTPTRLLGDVQAARTKLAQNKVNPPVTKPETPAVATNSKPTQPSPNVAASVTTPPTGVRKPSESSVAAVPPLPVWPDEPKPPVTPGVITPPRPAVAVTPPKPDMPKPVIAAAPPPSDTEGARALLQAGRKALKGGDLEKAKALADQAAKKRPNLEFFEDNPSKLQADIAAAEARRGGSIVVQATPPKTEATPQAKPTDPAGDPRAMLKQARVLYADGKLEEARLLAQKANAVPTGKWGLFEDSPDRLLQDIQKARLKHDQDDSARILAEARKLYDAGKYNEAEAKAYQADRLHGPYGMLDLGDRPSKLLADIQTVRAKGHKPDLPPAPGTVVAQNPPKPGTAAPGVTPPVPSGPNATVAQQKPLPSGPNATVAQQKPVPTGPSATVAQQKPVPTGPSATVAQQTPVPTGPSSPVAPQTPVPSGPSAPVAQETPVPTGPSSPFAPQTPVPSGPSAPVAQQWPVPSGPSSPTPEAGTPTPVVTQVAATPDPKKQIVQQMMVEVRALQQRGMLVEARQKALEAQKYGVTTFDPNEDRPETALLQLAALADKKIEALMAEATDYAATGQSEPARFQKAQSDLEQAKQLAQGFGLDAQPVNNKMDWVKQMQNKTVVAETPGTEMPVVSAPPGIQPLGPQVSPAKQRGLELLAKSRQELRNGQTLTARRMAEEAFSGPYEVQTEAQAMLRSIDAEEFNQHVRDAERAYDSGMDCYKRKDYTGALAILKNCDVKMLPDNKRHHLGEIMSSPEMQVRAPTAVATGNAPPVPGAEAPAAIVQAKGSAAGADNYAKQVQVMQDIEFQRLRTESLKVLQDAAKDFQAGDVDRALDSLTDYRNHLSDSGLDQDRVVLLSRQIDDRIQKFKTLKAQKSFEQLTKQQKESLKQKQAHEELAEQQKQAEIKELMKQYNAFRKEGKFREAQLAAAKARELDPDNPLVDAAIFTAQTLESQAEANEAKHSRERLFVGSLNDVEDQGPAVNSKRPLNFPKDFGSKNDRKKWESILITHRTEKEREIENRLNNPVNVDFKDTPLQTVLNDLRAYSGVNIVVDQPALEEANIRDDAPLTMSLEGVSMKSALSLLLHQVHLTYVIKEEVIQVTSEKYARGKLVQKTYAVADLVIPVDNHLMPANSNIFTAMNQPQQGNQNNGAPSLHPSHNGLPDAPPVSSSLVDQPNRVTSNQTTSPTPPATSTPANTLAPGQAQTMENLLIRLITSTIRPDSWSDVGGPGTIEYYPLGMALVINQVPDVQEQVQELLDALRRLQDLEVSVEVRMITLAEAFFERIGVDFNVNINPHVPRQFQAQIVTQQFQPLNQINFPDPQATILGTTPAGTATPDLFIPVKNSSFNMAIPPFGGFPNLPGADGGLSMGLAFLSDIQVFMFMEAAQGDRRTNVMQAPKITLFNGQTATIQIQDFQYFITNVQVVQTNGQIAFVPQNQPIPLGVNLAVQAVVSADRRFVRLNINPTLTNLSSALVPLFPITTFITPVFEGGAQGQPIPFTQFIQQPTFTTVTVQTSVSVPDGGTVLMGGLKLLNEGRNEFGPPILSKVPYLSRLFKNVGYGRDTSSLLIMVTPRVIINSEEELLQTNVGEPRTPVLVP
jgi:type II secretory pathway component GspD/PulD (secretin)